VKGLDKEKNLDYFGVTEVFLRYANFVTNNSIDYKIVPAIGIAWETNFSIFLSMNPSYAYDC
jgi:hypothetical protein